MNLREFKTIFETETEVTTMLNAIKNNKIIHHVTLKDAQMKWGKATSQRGRFKGEGVL